MQLFRPRLTLVLLALVCRFCVLECAQPLPEPSFVIVNKQNKISIYDGIISKKILRAFTDLVKQFAPWDFIYPEPEVFKGTEKKQNGNIHWIGEFSPKGFAGSRIWKLLRTKLPGFFKGKEYLPYEAHSVLINRGDFPTVQKGNMNSTGGV